MNNFSVDFVVACLTSSNDDGRCVDVLVLALLLGERLEQLLGLDVGVGLVVVVVFDHFRPVTKVGSLSH